MINISALRLGIRSLLPPNFREDYRRSRDLAKTQQTFREPSPLTFGTFLRRMRLTFAPRRTVLFYPQLPINAYVIYKLCAILGYKPISDPRRRHDVAIHYFSTTCADSAELQRLPVDRALLNGRVRDTSKTAVAAAFERTFGYCLKVDPATYRGKAVEKPEENGVHDARVVDCPLAPEAVKAGYTYQKAIDNSRSDGSFLDYRVPVHGCNVPLVFCKHVQPGRQFELAYTRVDVRAPEQVFDREELGRIVAFARDFGLDFGEVDVLRDRTDGRIYIVDVNNAPVGPRAHTGEVIEAHARGALSEIDRAAMLRMACSFEQLVEYTVRRYEEAARAAPRASAQEFGGARSSHLN